MFNSQVELEQDMQMSGRIRAHKLMKTNEEKGRAAHNVYARPLFNRFVQPLAALIQKSLDEPGAGIHKAHNRFLRVLEPEVVAFIAVRTVLVDLMVGKDLKNNCRRLCYQVGKNVQMEQVIKQFELIDQKAYYKMNERLSDRCSQSIEDRITLTKHHLDKRNIAPIDWGHGARDQVGAYLMECLGALGMVEFNKYNIRKNGQMRKQRDVSLTMDVMDLIKDAGELFAENTPFMLPCVEQPNDWTDVFNGGYHTPAMQKASYSAIIGGNPSEGSVDKILEAINCMQRVGWSINTKVLEVARNCVKQGDMEEICGPDDKIKPAKPDWLLPNMEKKDHTINQAQEFKAWKLKVTEWYTETKRRKQHRARMQMCFNVAHKFKDERELFFVYQADFRGRFYPRTLGINPQGSDLQKSMLQFSEGKKLKTKESQMWFMVHGANKAGYDKATLEDRVKWVNEHSESIIATAEDPLGNTWWKKVDKPFQFLAWCFEYADFKKYGWNFLESRLPISMDGSCNGLQNFSAAFRDEVGAKATNLAPNSKPQDIYQQVANLCLDNLRSCKDPDPEGFRERWIKHGVSRKLVKRSVMTLPYGSKLYSCRDFILHDYMIPEQPEEFTKEEHPKAAQFLAKVLWESIGQVVIKAREAMTWLQNCAKIIIKKEKNIQWTTPSGFRVFQDYRKYDDVGRLRVALFGGASITMHARSKMPNVNDHRNGIAPNFVHSLDAAHMQRVALRCKAEGIKHFAMIHDDFGTHALDADKFNLIIREEFVKMYEDQDWMQLFYDDYTAKGFKLPLPPKMGKFDIKEVLKSRYFFA